MSTFHVVCDYTLICVTFHYKRMHTEHKSLRNLIHHSDNHIIYTSVQHVAHDIIATILFIFLILNKFCKISSLKQYKRYRELLLNFFQFIIINNRRQIGGIYSHKIGKNDGNTSFDKNNNSFEYVSHINFMRNSKVLGKKFAFKCKFNSCRLD